MISNSSRNRISAAPCGTKIGVVEAVDDRVADHPRAAGSGKQLLGEVVAEHRQRADHEPGEDPLSRLRQRDAPERLGRARAEVTARLEDRGMDAIQRGEQRAAP